MRDERLQRLKALASPVRLQILEWLKDPVKNFPPQKDGDLIKDGVCADFIRDKLGLAPATASRHLSMLTESGFLIPTRKKGWTFYRRHEPTLSMFTKNLRSTL